MVISLKQRELKFKSSINLKHNKINFGVVVVVSFFCIKSLVRNNGQRNIRKVTFFNPALASC